MMEKQMIEKQMREKQMMEASKAKIQHPKDSDEQSESENINEKLAKLQENEDENVALHNLTNSELMELNAKLEMMNNAITNE